MAPVELNSARQEEITAGQNKIDTSRQFGMYEDVLEEQRRAETGKLPIGLWWLDVAKNVGGETFIRSRLVARDFR